MGQYANITSRKMRQLLQWLAYSKQIDVTVGGSHPAKVTCRSNDESYPLPISHTMVNKHIVKDFMEWLVRNDVCTKEEFDERV